MSVDFKGAQYPKSVILYAVYFYVRYGVSYRDLEEIMAERGADVDHATLNRWVVKFSASFLWVLFHAVSCPVTWPSGRISAFAL
jgi:transposase-like protein